ncbi:MAG: type II toxin-antitoxin system RelE/ParE family toxin [Chitinophagales bacterium]|nr:type II toxin-antitoxin system RelE/ParE family toxin [Chitinophagales bacterium]
MQIEWSDDAIQQVNEIIAYYESEGFIKAADNFQLALVKTITKIVKMPSSGMPSRSIEGVRSMQIDSKRRLFYDYVENAHLLQILDIFDLRQHPSKRKF